MELLNSLSLTLASLLSMAVSPAPVEAEQVPTCLELYNGGPTCKTSEVISIDKTVQNPTNAQFVDQIEPNDTQIQPGNSIIFRVVITNTSERNLEDISFTDTISNTLTFQESQQGTFNASNNVLSYTIDSLEAGEEETFDIMLQIKPQEELPSLTGPLCIPNIAEVSVGDEEASDNVQLCLTSTQSKNGTENGNGATFPIGSPTPTTQPANGTTKGGQVVHDAPTSDKSPDTGPELLALAGLLPAGLAGFYLRRKTSISNH